MLACVLLWSLVVGACALERGWLDMTDAELATDGFITKYKWLGPTDSSDFHNASALIASYSPKAPCRAQIIRDNCYGHNPRRARLLARRTFGSSAVLNTTEVLNTLENQVIFFAGDSTVNAVFTSLVCHFSQFTEVKYDLKWYYNRSTVLTDEGGQDKCPDHPTCRLINGRTFLPQYNIRIVYQQVHVYEKRERELFLQVVEKTHPTVAIVNFGVHYNYKKQHILHLTQFNNDLKFLLDRQITSNARMAQWLWLESFPQHFPGERGYFPRPFTPALPNNTHWCAPIPNIENHYADDWRNRLPEVYVPLFNSSNRVIAIAEALYSQWDAHIDHGDTLRSGAQRPDCAHYCLGSGVFRYALSEILTSVMTCLRGGCREIAESKTPKKKKTRKRAGGRKKSKASWKFARHFNLPFF